jgi:acetoacetate decarboxylase
VKDIRDAVAMGKLKCLGDLSSAAIASPDTQNLLTVLSGSTCQVLPPNAFEMEGNYAKVKDFGIQTDLQMPTSVLNIVIDCKGSNRICEKVRNQLNEMYGGSACPTLPNNGFLTCNLQI